MRRFLLVILALLNVATGLRAQNNTEPADSLVRLMSAQSAEMVNFNGSNYRKVIGPARFLHNNTYLICDTAFWYVETRVINAFGHVQILQNETVLSSDKLNYYIDDDLAEFRGSTVQLQDKDRNTLRTNNLDYNTKDSVAVFRNGGAMRDKNGQIIESTDGTYDSKTKIFTFDKNVNMFTDSVFVKTSSLVYRSKEDVAEFDYGVDAWQDENMLSASKGKYDRGNELFFFSDDVHGLSDVQEAWADTMYFHKLTNDLELYGNVQLTDDSRKVSGLSGNAFYQDSLATVTMNIDATVIAEVSDSTDVRDTIYFAADRIVYQTIRKCDIDEAEIATSAKRLSDLDIDPVSEYRAKAAESAKEEAANKEKELAKRQGRPVAGEQIEEAPPAENPEAAQVEEPAPEPSEPEENTEPEEPVGDQSGADTSEPEPSAEQEPKDTTKVAFIHAKGQVRVFKSDMQARCDSLIYTDLDSLARLYEEPIIWNEGNRQYVADSLTIVVENSRMQRASLMSNAFIVIQEDSVSFDQICAAEMMAYFDSTTVLERFDAMGGSSAVFYLEENDALATVNKVDSKMLSAYFSAGELDRIYYFDNPHNDAYPSVQLPKEDKQMKGFKWNPDLRPTGKADITPYELRSSERVSYRNRPKATFKQTDKYFPGYMADVYRSIAARDSAKAADKRYRDSLAMAPPADSLALADSMLVDEPPADSLSVDEPPEIENAMNEPSDTLQVAEPQPAMSAKDSLKAAKAEIKEARARKRDEKLAAKDARYDKKQAEKEARRLEKKRKDTARRLDINEKAESHNQKVLDKYLSKYEKQKAKADRRLERKEARKADKPIKVKKRKQTEPEENNEVVDG